MPHIDITSVILNILTKKIFNVHILLSADFQRIMLHKYAIDNEIYMYLFATLLATLAFRLSFDVSITVDNTI